MRRWIRITVSLAAALALHALLFLLLPQQAEQKKPARPPPLRVDLLRKPTKITNAHENEHQHAREHAHEYQHEPQHEHEYQHELEHGHEHEIARWSTEWSEEEGLAPPARGLSLELHSPPHSATAEARPPDEKSIVARRIESWAGDSKARQRAEVPDEYWRGIREALERGFSPDRNMLARAAPLEGWRRAAEAYGKSGNPFAAERAGSERNELRGLDSVSLGGAPQGAINLGAILSLVQDGWGGGHLLVALVRITQHEDGALFAVELAQTSGSPAFDKLALSQARSLSKLKLGAPPQGTMTLWAFETDFAKGPGSRVRLEAIY